MTLLGNSSICEVFHVAKLLWLSRSRQKKTPHEVRHEGHFRGQIRVESPCFSWKYCRQENVGDIGEHITGLSLMVLLLGKTLKWCHRLDKSIFFHKLHQQTWGRCQWKPIDLNIYNPPKTTKIMTKSQATPSPIHLVVVVPLKVVWLAVSLAPPLRALLAMATGGCGGSQPSLQGCHAMKEPMKNLVYPIYKLKYI